MGRREDEGRDETQGRRMREGRDGEKEEDGRDETEGGRMWAGMWKGRAHDTKPTLVKSGIPSRLRTPGTSVPVRGRRGKSLRGVGASA
jgi:hypothetical protein